MGNKHNHDLNLDTLPGDYQYAALHKKKSVQGQWHKNRHNLINHLKFLKKDDNLLDVGCGSGNVILTFSNNVKSATGIDNSAQCISFLKKQIAKNKLSNTYALKMDILNLSLNKSEYSKIIMTEVIEHFSEKEGKNILKSLHSHLKPGGKILITTPNYNSSWAIMEPLMDILNLSPKLWGDQHLMKYTPKRLTHLLNQAGFSVEQKGTLNLISPFLAPLSPKLADKTSVLEFKFLPFGNLLYAIAVKK